MIDKLVEARRILEQSRDLSNELRVSALRAAVKKILEYLEDMEAEE